jgi:hypothetical protein
MKKLYFIIIISLCLHSFNVKAQLTGNAFLQGQTNHSGIKVKFISQGGTAVTDSTTTTSTGSYSVNITSGVYKIVFTKAGYLTSNYNNGISTLLTNTVVLNNDTLLPGNQIFVSGNVSGNWTNNNTYIVNGNITIPANDTLLIQYGTSIRFNGYYSVIDNGVLFASGTPANPILFTSNISTPAIGDWNSIQIYNSSSIIDNCIVEYAFLGISFDNFNPIISNNIVRNAVMGIHGASGFPHVINNEVYNIINNSGSSAIGISVWNSNGIVECNHVYNCSSNGANGYGIITGSSFIRNNVVHDISGFVATGIQTRGSSDIDNNYVYNCGSGISVSNPTVTPYPVIRNNTITNCNLSGIRLNDDAGNAYNPSIVNNIIVNCYDGMYQSGSQPTSYNVSNNLVWNNSHSNYDNIQVVGVGIIVSTNSQGNPIDSYYNMSQDPIFVGGPPILSSASPCLNSGNATYSSNIGYNPSSSCISSINSVPSFVNSGSQINIYPNPANNHFIIETNSTEMILVDLFDINGKRLFSKNFIGKTYIETNNLDNGVYTLSVKNNLSITNKKIIIAR